MENLRPLIFIVAYNAERHIDSVFQRIPYERLPAGTEILLIDDASPDSTYAVASQAAGRCPVPVVLLKNPVNLGYGGNQKLGYQFAIENGFAAVVLIHGDGQYAPELIPEMLNPILDGKTDIVLGSRMLHKKDALKGGMPLYKWVGNQVLTWMENRILGMDLTEFHTGLRAYGTAALKRIPFHLNTNDFHFDTDILIQCHRVGSRFHEIPIPTRYGDEVCHVDGWKYFFSCLRSCLRDWMTQKGIFYCRRFDLAPPDSRYESKLGIKHSSHRIALALVAEGSKVLDIGGGNGWLADALSDSKKCSVVILDDHFGQKSDLKHTHILNDFKNSKVFDFEIPKVDCALLLDVIEHIPRKQHAALLDALRVALDDPPAKLIISVPNTAFLPLRLSFALLGRLNYSRRGILDDTHAFLFTKHSLKELMEECGFSIQSWHHIPPPYELAFGNGAVPSLLTSLHALAARLLPGIFAYQHLVEATIRPTVSTLIRHSFENSEKLKQNPY